MQVVKSFDFLLDVKGALQHVQSVKYCNSCENLAVGTFPSTLEMNNHTSGFNLLLTVKKKSERVSEKTLAAQQNKREGKKTAGCSTLSFQPN